MKGFVQETEYADSNGIPWHIAEEIVTESQNKLVLIVKSGELSTDGLTHADVEILVDAIEGSTFVDGSECDCAHGEISTSQFRAICDAHADLESFIEDQDFNRVDRRYTLPPVFDGQNLNLKIRN